MHKTLFEIISNQTSKKFIFCPMILKNFCGQTCRLGSRYLKEGIDGKFSKTITFEK